jgi:hypothetical protein
MHGSRQPASRLLTTALAVLGIALLEAGMPRVGAAEEARHSPCALPPAEAPIASESAVQQAGPPELGPEAPCGTCAPEACALHTHCTTGGPPALGAPSDLTTQRCADHGTAAALPASTPLTFDPTPPTPPPNRLVVR